MRTGGRWGGASREAAILAGFVLLALAFTYPLWLHWGYAVVAPAEDPQLNRWILAWDAHALLTEPARLFDANIFYPYPISLAYSENLLGSAAIGLPLQLLLDDPTATYGVLTLLTFVLSGYGAYLLGRRVSGRWWAGVIAGVIFAFCPYKMSQIHHFQNLSAQWMPFAFLALDRAIEGGRRREYLLFGLFTVLQALTSIYYALFLAVGVVLYAGVRLALRWGSAPAMLGRRLIGLLCAGTLAVGCVLPVFLPYQKVVTQMDAGRSLSYVAQLAPDALNYLAAPAGSLLYGRLTAPLRKEPEGSLFPGIVALLLALAGVVAYVRGRRRGVTWALVILAAGAGLLSLGPTIHVAGQALFSGPYVLLWRYAPGFSGVRVPGRFAVLVMLGVAVLAALGAAAVVERQGRGSRRGAVVLALLLALGLEYAVAPWPTQTVAAAMPPATAWLAQQAGDFAIVELPIDVYPAFEHDIAYVSASTQHWKRLVNGYSGYFPTGYLALTEMLQTFPDEASLTALRRLGVRYAVVHRGALTLAQAAALDAGLAQHMGELALAGDFGATRIYALAGGAGAPALSLGTPEARPFLLKGFSPRDERDAGRPFVWNEAEDGGLLLPASDAGLRRLGLTARSAQGEAHCRLWLDDDFIGEMALQETADVQWLELPAPAAAGVHHVRWRCAGGEAPTLPPAIGETGVIAPADLAAAAGLDYADLYVAGKRYSLADDCAICVGALALVGTGRAGDDYTVSLYDEAAGPLRAYLEGLPVGAVLLLAAPARSDLPAEAWPLLAQYGAAEADAAGGSYVLLGVRGAVPGSAAEAACADGCWRYVGQPWPARRLAVERVELSP